ncbi:hypothetical protein [uncultured Clostridium sp.]|uniref:hypothetical protein n=1 Tax=uncultured Clostridium sp. TaxID=59620 RepID=UPI0025F187EE|nr:hypothetical protein [uncultured Clostridium sp.]
MSSTYVEAIMTCDSEWIGRRGGIIELMGKNSYRFQTELKDNDGVESRWTVYIAIYDIKSEKEYYTRLRFLMNDDIVPWKNVKKGNKILIYDGMYIVGSLEVISGLKTGEFYEGC